MIVHTENVQIIEQNGQPAFAVLPWDEYQELLNKSDVWFPNDVVKANARGCCLVKAWRNHFNMTQKKLAEKSGIKQSTIARLEANPDSKPRKSTLEPLAKAFGISLEQLTE